MSAPLVNVPENVDALACWLEDQLTAFNLSGVVDALRARCPAPPPDGPALVAPALEALLGEALPRILEHGFETLTEDEGQRLRDGLTRHPELLFDLQEAIFLGGGAYWDQRLALPLEAVPASYRRVIDQAGVRIGKRITAGPERPRPTGPPVTGDGTPVRKRKLALATAALLVGCVALGALGYYRSDVAERARQQAREGELRAELAQARNMLARLHNDLEVAAAQRREWEEKADHTVEALKLFKREREIESRQWANERNTQSALIVELNRIKAELASKSTHATKSSAMQHLEMANQMIRYGRQEKCAECLLMAAQILHRTPGEPLNAARTVTDKGGEKPAPATVLDNNPRALVAEARKMSSGPAVEQLALATEKMLQEPHLPGSAYVTQLPLPARRFDNFTIGPFQTINWNAITFPAGARAEVYISTGVFSRMRLEVLDEQGNVVARDTVADSYYRCVWYPRWTGPFRFRLTSNDNLSFSCSLRTN